MPSRAFIATVALLLANAQVHADVLQDASNAVQRKDYATAVRLLEPLAQAGQARAQTQLATLYYQGHGVPEDNAKAMALYERAARQGHAQAQFQLGNMFAYGHAAVPQGHDAMRLAAQWIFEAARQGHVDAQYSLGLLFLSGSGVQQNAAEARKWFTRAASHGHADARAYLRASAAK
jgi:uncharacterized protein